jgi:hypothetical protein
VAVTRCANTSVTQFPERVLGRSCKCCSQSTGKPQINFLEMTLNLKNV